MAEARAMLSNRPSGSTRRGLAAVLAVLAICALSAVPALAAQGPTKLESPLVSPTAGTPATTITFEVSYRTHNAKAPNYVRVAIDGTDHEMTPVGELDYRAGVLYRWTGALPVGTHTVLFNAQDSEKFADELAGANVTINPPPPPPPDPTPTPPPPDPTPNPDPTPAPNPNPNPVSSGGSGGTGSGGSGSSSGSDGSGTGTTEPGGSGTSGSVADPTEAGDGRGSSSAATTDTGHDLAAFGWVPAATTWDGTGGPSDPTGSGGSGTDGTHGSGGSSGSGGSGSGSTGTGSGSTGSGDPDSVVGGQSGDSSSGPSAGAAFFLMVSDLFHSVGADPLAELLPGGGSTQLPTLVTALGSSAAVGVWMAFSLFGKRRRDEQAPAPDAVLQAAAASGLGLVPSSGLIPELQDPELMMPRWRRPSLLQARARDPQREGLPVRQSLAFGHDTATSNERRLIRYATVRLLDRPDEVMGLAVGDLGAGDEVELCERSGLFWFVRAPDGRAGWLHRMTLGDQVAPGVRAAV